MIKQLSIAALFAALAASATFGAERKPLVEIDTDQFTEDTQSMAQGAGDEHLALAWWIPNEFWGSILERDATTPQSDKDAMLEALAGVSLLAVTQADISRFGAFNFYDKEQVEEGMSVTFQDEEGAPQQVKLLRNPNPDLEIVLSIFKPILGNAMGQLGQNMYFYVLDDVSKSDFRILDPYEPGQIRVALTRSDSKALSAEIDLPINSLFVPRKCPNGKDAHITWAYCPWSGEKLVD